MIVITTPTGQIGRQVLDALLDGERQVRVIARDPSRLSARVRERVDVVPGSHGDRDVVMEAFAGADSVFWLVPPDPRADSVERHYLDWTRPACEAITRHGVERVVAVSTLGTGIEKNAGHLTASVAKDELIKSTGVGFRALRAAAFMENLLGQADSIRDQGTFHLPSRADRVLATIATRDIAAAAVRLLLDDSWNGQAGVPLVSPDRLSPDDMARIMSEVLERPVRCRPVPLDAYKEAAVSRGASEGWAQGLVDMAAAQIDGAYDAEHHSAQPSPTGFRQWCEEVLRPAVLA
ncbi:NAD(P)H-binding protein [Streptomyces rochei]|uniref:NAD(P)H-binding protein n=1 Tax=Streptomyces TaxID=1883 RepID=UPI0004C6A2CF|nr:MULTISPECIES: NAD(P)H-binding protein [Streptomyces rochei group]MCC8449037.1 NAD(P)H-binding protein [Streptomyces rochei]WQC16974.1 NAD(P)H-binding protein [Streptomyces rochei]GGZ57896.1 NmrA family transcriptional regulator [Streptomyces plicatus]GHB94415.1 NmrA family transcriptional regulator [Streptomyces vinaceusdrappus]